MKTIQLSLCLLSIFCFSLTHPFSHCVFNFILSCFLILLFLLFLFFAAHCISTQLQYHCLSYYISYNHNHILNPNCPNIAAQPNPPYTFPTISDSETNTKNLIFDQTSHKPVDHPNPSWKQYNCPYVYCPFSVFLSPTILPLCFQFHTFLFFDFTCFLFLQFLFLLHTALAHNCNIIAYPNTSHTTTTTLKAPTAPILQPNLTHPIHFPP